MQTYWQALVSPKLFTLYVDQASYKFGITVTRARSQITDMRMMRFW